MNRMIRPALEPTAPDVDPLEHTLSLDRVRVDFPIYFATGRSLKRMLLNVSTAGRIGVSADDRVVVRALEDVSFSARHGDRIGIVGRNGAGKTTLLRVLAGVYEPVLGRVEIRGRVASLVDVTLGMDMDATGYENILIRGMILGLSRREAVEIMPQVAEFTELGAFLQMPVGTYSSGMLMRLAFGISTHIVPDVLLMDEWIGVGDASFIDKASKRLTDFISRASTLVLASHSDELIRNVCNLGIWLDQGRMMRFGPVDEVIAAYRSQSVSSS